MSDYLREALQAQLDVSLMLMSRLGYDEQAKADCTAQARNALAGTPGAVAPAYLPGLPTEWEAHIKSHQQQVANLLAESATQRISAQQEN